MIRYLLERILHCPELPNALKGFFSIQKQCFVHGKEKETGVKKKKKVKKNFKKSDSKSFQANWR